MSSKSAASDLCLAIKIEYGSNVLRYVARDVNTTLGGEVFTSIPSLEMKNYPELQAGVKEEKATFRISDSVEPFVSMRGVRFPTTWVTIYDAEPSTGTIIPLWQGFVGLVRFGIAGNNLNEVELKGFKSLLKVRLGIPVESKCPFTLGDENSCQFELSGVSGTIDSIDGRVVTIDDTAVTSQPTRYWQLGSIEYDGFQIGVWSWDDNSSFRLFRPPPAFWLGKLVTLYPGCDKTLGTCQTKFNNEEHFGGFGRAMPSQNPTQSAGR